MTTHRKKILVRLPQWLGDAVVSTVFLSRLKKKEPESEIWACCMAGLAPLFEPHPAVHGVLPLPYPAGTAFAAARRIREAEFDEAYVLPRSFRSAFEAAFARVPKRIGFKGGSLSIFFTDRIAYDPGLAYAHRYLSLIGESMISLENAVPFFPKAAPRDPLLARLEGPLLGVAPLSIAPSRTWLPDRFAAVADRWLARSNGTVVLFGSAKERDAVQAVADMISGRVVNTAGQLSLPELGGMMSRLSAFLGNDSGLMHVASVFQVPSTIVFGASDPSVALPKWGRFAAHQSDALPCIPCLRNHCVLFGENHNGCLKTVEAEHVFESLPA